MLRFKILQVRLEHSKEKIDIVGRLRDFENAFVSFLTRPGRRGDHRGFVLARIRKTDHQRQFFRDQIDRAQSQGELLQKTSKHEEQRLRRFDLVIELKTFLERFRWLNKFQEPSRGSICPFPESNSFRPKPRPKLFLIERRQLSKSMNSPLPQNRQNIGDLKLGAGS